MRQECECPACNGTGQELIPEAEMKYSWNKGKTHRPCQNCGGQTMYGKATGKSYLRDDGTACQHEYTGHTKGRCWTEYICNHCGYSYDIDSSD